jgi:hypothetical protein
MSPFWAFQLVRGSSIPPPSYIWASFWGSGELLIREPEEIATGWLAAGGVGGVWRGGYSNSLMFTHCSVNNYFMTTWYLLHSNSAFTVCKLPIRHTKMTEIRILGSHIIYLDNLLSSKIKSLHTQPKRDRSLSYLMVPAAWQAFLFLSLGWALTLIQVSLALYSFHCSPKPIRGCRTCVPRGELTGTSSSLHFLIWEIPL